MKKNAFILIILTYTICFSQQIDLRWGPEIKYKDFYPVSYTTKEAFYCLAIEKEIPYLKKYRFSDMNQEYSKILEFNPGTEKKFEPKDFLCFKNQSVFFYDAKINGNKDQANYSQKFDFEGKPKGGFIKIKEIKNYKKMDLMQKIISADSSKILMIESPSDKSGLLSKGESESYIITILNDNIDLLKSFEIKLPYKDKDFSLEDYYILNDGTVTLLARVDFKRKDVKKDEENYIYQIITINALQNQELKQYDLNLDRKYIANIQLKLDKKENIICLGTYSDMKDNGKPKEGINGIFFLTIDKTTGTITSKSTKEFPNNVVEKLTSARRARNDKGLNSEFKLKYITEKPDGGLIAVLEENYYKIVTICRQNGCTQTYHYYANDFLIINISKTNEIQSFIHIEKEQHSINDGGRANSFIGTFYNNKLYMLMNTQTNKYGKIEDKLKMKGSYKSVLPVMVTVDLKGNVEMNILGSREKTSFLTLIQYSSFRSDNKAILVAQKAGSGCFCSGGAFFGNYRHGMLTL